MTHDEIKRIAGVLKERHGKYAWDVANILEETAADYSVGALPQDRLVDAVDKICGPSNPADAWNYFWKLLTGEEWKEQP